MISRVKAGVALSVLVLTGCAGQGATVPAAPAASPSATAQVKPVVAPTKKAPATKAPEADSEGADSAFCKGVLADSRPAVAALKKLVKNPDGKGLTAADFQAPRDKLAQRAQSAPKHLQGYLKTQVAVLDQVTTDVTAVRDPLKKAQEFTDARMELVLSCEMVE